MQLPEELQFIANGRKPQKRTTARFDGKTCIITGATSGVGLAAARRIAQGGANLILVNRNPEKALKVKEEIQGEYECKVDLFKADFSDLTQVRDTATKILDKHPRIDALINNAGIHNNSRQLTQDGIEMVFCVNHLASFLLTRLLLERIKESAPSRILYVNSQGHRFGGLNLEDLNWEKRRYSGYQSYGAAKTAQLLTVWELADQLRGTGVTVNAMHPGGVTTNIGMNNGFLYRNYQRYLLFPFLCNPKISGEAIYYLIVAPEMEGVTGKYYNQTIEEKPALHALDREKGKKIWKISEELTGLAEEV
jgi:NAD(P)-dependent dehydrogenase (short-subunit alcohol dehydrogenase family)